MSLHMFETEVAEEYGLVEALLIKNLQFWIEYNKANNINLHDGRTWSYNSVRSLCTLFPYLGKKAIYNALRRLEDAGVILTGNYNPNVYNRTIWYAFADEPRWIFPKGKCKNSPKGESKIYLEGKSKDVLLTDELPHSKPSPAQARVGVFVVGADGVIIPKIPEPEKPEEPEIPTIPKIPVTDPPRRPPAEQPEKPEPRRNSRNSAPDTDWQRWVDRYEVHVKARTEGIGHNWTKVQLASLKALRAHLVKVSVKDPDHSDDDCGFHAWEYVLDHWGELGDDWLMGQHDLSVILKKITDIVNRLKNGAKSNRGNNPQGSGKLSASEARNAALRDY